MDAVSPQVQDYLKTIYTLEQPESGVSTNAIAEALGVRPASVTGMIKKLASMDFVEYTPYQGARLTPRGEKIALEVVRHHRLLEVFLNEVLGYSWDEVHPEADRLEHFISEDFEDRLAAHLGHPVTDPHGDPIPAKDGTLSAATHLRLAQLHPGESARVIRLDDRDPAMLRYAAEVGLIPGARVVLVDTDPFGGSLRVTVEGQERSIGPNLAQVVFIEADSLPAAEPSLEPAHA
jgi:DtxR family Mn-dependent transcriptional regulator